MKNIQLHEPVFLEYALQYKFLLNTIYYHYRIKAKFHIVFIEFDHDYYLIYLQRNYRPSQIIRSRIIRNKRCFHIRELFNSIVVNYPPLRRAKFYHKACRDRIELQCFYDSTTFMCLCDSERKANCFNYDFSIIRNCSGYNDCLNDADCFLDSPTCATSSVCQYVILGYHIRPTISLFRQTIALHQLHLL
ncbi:unnamed protein product [Adineta ricciae]|uniref:Uncharacterized protein n=1 Tax=Adineta ricciae TaxID=249248 RepID=A0A815PDG6_ADIRI|nr:unnamed protein product [Adineta ricciae]CAF1447427.1 unnamed protein product [Adineta ricciae]